MSVTEYFEEVVSKKKVHVASCMKCGSTDILLSDCGYSSFNYGGGKCKKCGHEVSTQVGSCFPTVSDLAKIWNAENDKHFLIGQAKARIILDQALIEELEKELANEKHSA